MLTRRTFLSGAALAAATPTLAAPFVASSPAAEAATTTLPLEIVSRRHGRKLYAAICGVDPTSGRWCFVSATGARIFPAAGSVSPRAVSDEVAIAVPAPVARGRCDCRDWSAAGSSSRATGRCGSPSRPAVGW